MTVTPFRLVLAKLGATAILAPALAGSALAQDARSGQLSGESGHVTTGTVAIQRDGDRTLVVLGDDFSLDGAPDPTLGFAEGGAFDLATEFSDLHSLTGGQTYELPSGVDVSEHDTFVVWCSEFAVPLGSAPLN